MYLEYLEKLKTFIIKNKDTLIKSGISLALIFAILSSLTIEDKKIKHKVSSGENLTTIAHTYNMTLEELRWLNPKLSDTDIIQVGEKITVYNPDVIKEENRKEIMERFEDAEKEGKYAQGIDVSFAQGSVDIGTLLANNDVDFVISRMAYFVTQSTVDDDFYIQAREAKETGVPLGAYYWPYASNIDGAKEEVRKIKESLDKLRKEGIYLEMPIALDIEKRSDGGGTMVERILREDKGTIEALKYTARELEKDYYVMLYASENCAELILPILKKHGINLDLWIAKYAYGKNHPVMYKGESFPILKTKFDSSLGIHQVAESGRLIGYPDTNIDIDRAYRNYPKLIKKANKNYLNTKGYRKFY